MAESNEAPSEREYLLARLNAWLRGEPLPTADYVKVRKEHEEARRG